MSPTGTAEAAGLPPAGSAESAGAGGLSLAESAESAGAGGLSLPEAEGSAEAGGMLSLAEAEREVLAAEAVAFSRALSDPRAAARYRLLAQAAESGQVPPDLLAPLQSMLQLVFEKGRPANRAVLQSIFARTPSGRLRVQAAREVNAALQSLRGQSLVSLRVSALPAAHTLVLETDRCRVTLELDASGARIASLEAG
ncbi:MAG TPA: hypothetical protein VF937_13945 [Chloroflexota bacterium]